LEQRLVPSVVIRGDFLHKQLGLCPVRCDWILDWRLSDNDISAWTAEQSASATQAIVHGGPLRKVLTAPFGARGAARRVDVTIRFGAATLHAVAAGGHAAVEKAMQRQHGVSDRHLVCCRYEDEDEDP